MQAAIDSAKRRFDINVSEEIHLIKQEMKVSEYKYPKFWKLIKRDFNKNLINEDLHCPMNYLCDLKFIPLSITKDTIPMTYFFQKYDIRPSRTVCRRIEDLIETFSLKVKDFNINEYNNEENILLRSDFDDLVLKLQTLNISGKYIGLFSWLIDRTFRITPSTMKSNSNRIKSKLNKNKSLLIKILYKVNKDNLLKCFSKNLPNKQG